MLKVKFCYMHEKQFAVPIEHEAGCSPEPVRALWRRENLLAATQESNHGVVIVQLIA
jgi:hypothetical protein